MKQKTSALKTWFLTGLLVLVPLAITLWVLSLIIGTMDQSLALLPSAWQPDQLFGRRIPGVGAILTLAFILIVGVLAHNFIGQKLVLWWEALVGRIPVVGPIYSSVKQVSDTLLSSNGNAFRKALLVQYPREGSWTIAFLTGRPGGDVENHLQGEYVSVYVPTTPNPTSGFFLMMPKADTIELDMTVDAALKYIVSIGGGGARSAAAPHGPARCLATDGGPVAGSSAARPFESDRAACRGRRHRGTLSRRHERSRIDAGLPINFHARRFIGGALRGKPQHANAYSILRSGHRTTARPERHAVGLGPSSSRPRWRDLHRPARP